MDMKISLVHKSYVVPDSAVYNEYKQVPTTYGQPNIQCTVCYVEVVQISDLYACKRLHTRINFDYVYPSYDLYDWVGTMH